MRRIAVLVLAAWATCALAPVAAEATHVQCGDVITADTKLDSDLECGGVALTIAAPGATLDLGGHTVSAATPPSASDGIVASGVSGIAVRNGSVHGFAVDISLSGVSGALVRDIAGASTFVEGDGNTVRNHDAAAGIAVRGNANLITSNVVTEPFDPTEASWVSVSGDDNYITHNVVTNVGPTAADQSAFGLLLRLNGGLVARNVATAAPGWELSFPGATVVGMHLSGLLRAVVRRNEASGHTDGFLLQAPDRFLVVTTGRGGTATRTSASTSTAGSRLSQPSAASASSRSAKFSIRITLPCRNVHTWKNRSWA